MTRNATEFQNELGKFTEMKMSVMSPTTRSIGVSLRSTLLQEHSTFLSELSKQLESGAPYGSKPMIALTIQLPISSRRTSLILMWQKSLIVTQISSTWPSRLKDRQTLWVGTLVVSLSHLIRFLTFAPSYLLVKKVKMVERPTNEFRQSRTTNETPNI